MYTLYTQVQHVATVHSPLIVLGPREPTGRDDGVEGVAMEDVAAIEDAEAMADEAETEDEAAM